MNPKTTRIVRRIRLLSTLREFIYIQIVSRTSPAARVPMLRETLMCRHNKVGPIFCRGGFPLEPNLFGLRAFRVRVYTRRDLLAPTSSTVYTRGNSLALFPISLERAKIFRFTVVIFYFYVTPSVSRNYTNSLLFERRRPVSTMKSCTRGGDRPARITTSYARAFRVKKRKNKPRFFPSRYQQ